MTQYKTCTKCCQTKFLDSFNKCTSKKDGLMSHCRECRKLWRIANLDAEKARAKSYYQNNKERSLAYYKQWSLDNPEKIAVIKKRYRDNNKSEIAEGNKSWELSNPEKVKQKVTRRRALKKQAKTFFISEKEFWHLYNSKCFFCDSRADTIEHLIPLSRGGTHGIGNLVSACRSCNSSKRDKFIMEWKKSDLTRRLTLSKKGYK